MPSQSAGGITQPLDTDPLADIALAVRTALSEVGDPWTAYTPTLTAATTNPTLGTGSAASGAWRRIGKTVVGRARITCGTSGTAAGSGVYRISLPVAAKAGVAALGHGIITDGAGGAAVAVATKDSATTAFNMWGAASTSTVNQSTYNVIANREYIFEFMYEAA